MTQAAKDSGLGRKSFVIGVTALPGNPNDGHTLQAFIEPAERVSGVKLKALTRIPAYNLGMPHSPNISGQTVALKLDVPPLVAKELGRASNPSKLVTRVLTEWAEQRAAEKAARAAIKHNKGKPSISAEELYKQCGL